MRLTACLLPFLLLAAPILRAETIPATVRVQTLTDRSGYKGQWKLGPGITAIVRESLQASSFQAVETGEAFVLSGVIREYELNSRGIASYGMGGYQDFSAKVVIDFTLASSTGSVLLRYTAEGSRVQKNLGLSLMGGPVGDRRYQDDLKRLWSLPLDSAEFRNSILGQAIYDAVAQAVPQMAWVVHGKPFGLKTDVVSLRGPKAYIGAGREENLDVGQEFIVYAASSELTDPRTGRVLGSVPRTRVGRIRVTEILGPHLAAGDVIEGLGSVKERDAAVFE